MAESAKLLVLGPPDGGHSSFVSSVSEVKIRSSARTPTGSAEGFVPMDFGRVRIAIDLDLQLFGFERDQAAKVVDAVSPGIVGAILLVDQHDSVDPHYAARALDELSQRGIVTVLGVTEAGIDSGALARSLGAPESRVIFVLDTERETVKQAVLAVLEAALQAEESAA
ncbi:MAG: hypothetical protein ACRD1T_08360 [Acidimicrobiia bacterium]